MWYIDPNINGGYPTNTDFLSPVPAGFTDNDTINLPANIHITGLCGRLRLALSQILQ